MSAPDQIAGVPGARFRGRLALVSGGGSGIGRATAARLAAEGASVVVCDIDAESARAVTAELGGDSVGLELDVSDSAAWEQAVSSACERFGRLDALVNCAGILREEPIDRVTVEGWDRTLSVNLDGTFFGCMSAIGEMRRGAGGAIVNLASISAKRADDTYPAYCTSKGAVLTLTEEIAAQCARRGDGVRCNAILPGTIRTSMTAEVVDDPVWLPPIGRVGEPEEVAALATFLCSEEAACINGMGTPSTGVSWREFATALREGLPGVRCR